MPCNPYTMIDIVFPKNNEEEFLKIAKELGIKQVLFLYKKGKFWTGKLHNKTIIVAKAEKNSRELIEKSPAEIIFGLEEASPADFMHHRASGLNQIVCKAIKKKKKIVAFSFSSLLTAKRSQIMGKMQQNFRLCKKYNLPVIIASFAAYPYTMRKSADLKALFLSLGMHPGMAKSAFQLLKAKFDEK